MIIFFLTTWLVFFLFFNIHVFCWFVGWSKKQCFLLFVKYGWRCLGFELFVGILFWLIMVLDQYDGWCLSDFDIQMDRSMIDWWDIDVLFVFSVLESAWMFIFVRYAIIIDWSLSKPRVSRHHRAEWEGWVAAGPAKGASMGLNPEVDHLFGSP